MSPPTNPVNHASRQDRILAWAVYISAFFASIVLLFIITYLLIESSDALSHIGLSRLFTDNNWFPHELAKQGNFNILAIITGSLCATGLAIFIAGPLSIATAIFMRLYLPTAIQTSLRTFIEVLTGIPSVVYGLWGLVTLVPLINRLAPPGASLLAGGIILAMMIWPTITLACDNAINNVDNNQQCAAIAMGLSPLAILRTTILPSTWPAFSMAILLGLGRALGETMAILMVCGNIIQVPQSLFDPIRTLTSNIALEMGYAVGDHRSALFAMGLILAIMMAAIVFIAHRFNKKTGVHAC